MNLVLLIFLILIITAIVSGILMYAFEDKNDRVGKMFLVMMSIFMTSASLMPAIIILFF
jgi:hypothetical protein